MIIPHLVWMFLKLVREKKVINHSSYLDVLKIRIERRETNLPLFENRLTTLVYD